MLKNPSQLVLLSLGVLFCCSGATCWPRGPALDPPPPIVFQSPPTLPELIAAVNANSQPVRQLQTDGATLHVQGLPPLQTEVAVERPRRFRLRSALLQFTGPELDLGSNDQLFWMWVKRNPEQAIYFARHDQFANSPMRRLLPIEPEWLVDAFGLVSLDPRTFYEGPFREGDERLWIRARGQGASGDLTKVLFIDARHAYVVEQHLYDAGGGLLAKVQGTRHRHYSLEGVTLPHRVEIQLAPGQPTELAFALEVGGYRINQVQGDPARLWDMPQLEGYRLVDLADPRIAPPSGWMPATAPVSPPPAADVSYRQRYRGYGPPAGATVVR